MLTFLSLLRSASVRTGTSVNADGIKGQSTTLWISFQGKRSIRITVNSQLASCLNDPTNTKKHNEVTVFSESDDSIELRLTGPSFQSRPRKLLTATKT